MIRTVFYLSILSAIIFLPSFLGITALQANPLNDSFSLGKFSKELRKHLKSQGASNQIKVTISENDSVEFYVPSKKTNEVIIILVIKRIGPGKTQKVHYWLMNEQVAQIYIIEHRRNWIGISRQMGSGYYAFQDGALKYQHVWGTVNKTGKEMLVRAQTYLAKSAAIVQTSLSN
ncbi:MAG TPA: hypothetical protein VD993_17265 [Chitinophagaceae bacterium]|nr:hypothetical protein [Chitinophagaceae bacterium]